MKDRDGLKLRLQFLQQVKSKVRAYIGPETKDLIDYAAKYKETFTSRWKKSDWEELIAVLKESKIVLGGDFHAFQQSQRTHLRLLKKLSQTENIVLGVECFESKDQDLLDQYMGDEITIDQLLEQTNWKKKWKFPWVGYEALLEFAKRHGMKVYGLNKIYSKSYKKSLSMRDKHAAKIINQVYRDNPNYLIYIIFGDLHLAPQNLPKRLSKVLKSDPSKITTIYQNSEKIYFKLAKKGLINDVHVVRLNKNSFCLLSSPPWVKWQNYLIYLEQTSDLDLLDEEVEYEGIDFTDHLVKVGEIVLHELKIKKKLDDISVYTPESDSFWQNLSKKLSEDDFNFAKSLALQELSFFVPGGGIALITRHSLNHAAGLVGDYIQCKLSGRNRVLWTFPEDYHGLIWTQIWSFFCSKIVNHRRRPDGFLELKNRLSNMPDKGRDALLLALEFRLQEVEWLSGYRIKRQEYKVSKKLSYYEAGRILGEILGEMLFERYSKGEISLHQIKYWVSLNIDSENFYKEFQKIIKSIDEIPNWLMKRDVL